jgi:hypothetical protein
MAPQAIAASGAKFESQAAPPALHHESGGDPKTTVKKTKTSAGIIGKPQLSRRDACRFFILLTCS